MSEISTIPPYLNEQEDQQTAALKVPPNSVEAEQSVLGGLMLENSAWDKIADLISEDDFYRLDHKLIFKAIGEQVEQAKPYDAVTLADRLDLKDELDKVGGLAYLGMLAKNTPSAANVKAYAELVRERSVLRQLIAVGTEIANAGYQPEGRTSRELLDNAEKNVFEIADQAVRSRGGMNSVKHHASEAFKMVEKLFNSKEPITGVPTGFTEFDRMTSGLQGSDLIIVAGRPSMGKTTFAMNVAEHAAIKNKTAVAVFSMEMSGDSLALRMMSSLGRIDQHKVRTGQLDDQDWDRLMSSMGMLSDAPIYIDETPALSPLELRARARRLQRESNLGLIVIDYMQLMQGNGRAENRTNEVSEISRSLKALAKELHVPVICLSQLNRSLEQRPNKRPVMSDLRESGSIEQDADVIVFIYRDEVYNDDSPDAGTAEIIIGKQRNGPTGTCRLTFLGKYTRFENYVPELMPASAPPEGGFQTPSGPAPTGGGPDFGAPGGFDPGGGRGGGSGGFNPGGFGGPQR